MLIAGINIEKDTFSFANVVAINQRGIKSVYNSILYTMLTTSASHRHNSPTSILHDCFHIAEVTLDTTITGQSNELKFRK